MGKDRAPVYHLYDTSGFILCRGLALAEADHQSMGGAPVKVVFDRVDVTCFSCRAIIERMEREEAQRGVA